MELILYDPEMGKLSVEATRAFLAQHTHTHTHEEEQEGQILLAHTTRHPPNQSDELFSGFPRPDTDFGLGVHIEVF